MSSCRSTIREQLLSGRIVQTSTTGSSMEPLLFAHDTSVTVMPVDRELKKGDIVLFSFQTGKYVLHRIIGFDEGVCYTRGDNNIDGETVKNDQILGYVTEIYRKGKCIPVTDPFYRLYYAFWIPGRRFCRRVKRKAERILRIRMSGELP